ncbi:hypothetical protein N7519_003827 [Penicillium mononematosum]|uniref:uncharacterized protein n=1 Tax=Penicillium mononematosum TaxID=268346 RepID=UPI00254774D9|nr:uncharacterized protein N7519_003827 [Penicillium mononematosum]KAJ6188919.1 hypothetical protein N7519_003827 [Penicillium mononematosum]
MSSFARRNEGNDAYLMNHQMAVPGSYGQPENHDFKQESHDFNTHAFLQPVRVSVWAAYGPQSSLSPGLQHLQYTSEHSIPSMTTPDDPRLHHPPQFMSQSRYLQGPRYLPRDPLGETEIENQESHNEATLLSEAVVPALSGFPDVKEFDQLMQNYVEDLSIKKQDKALIYAKRARNIRTVLIDPKDTAVESAQFRFWVKKMFKLQAVGSDELISRFVKICPTCQVRRGGSRLTPPNSRRSSPRLEMVSRSPKLPSPPISRRESTFAGQIPLDRTQADYFGHLHGHSGWLDSHQNVQGRSNLGNGVRSFQGPMGNLSHSIAGTLDPFSADLSIPPSQLSYTTGYVSTHGTAPQREF